MEHMWVKLAPEMMIEWEQNQMEGRDVAHLKDLCEQITKTGDEKLAEATLPLLHNAPISEDFTFNEPSDYEGIQKEKPGVSKTFTTISCEKTLNDKIKGAWVGRIAGCLLGKPVEGYKREKLYRLLKETDNFPLKTYIAQFNETLVNQAAPIDDDTNYTVFSLKLIEKYGCDFTPNNVLEAWMAWIPYLATCTAERVAYRNAAMGLTAPQTATHKNPYREWIGAQIRTDFYGYISVGNPQQAAHMAWRDASISHIKNGIYGAMFIAAMMATAAVCNNIDEVIAAGLNEIPKNCRLRRDIDFILKWHKNGDPIETIIEKIHQQYNEHTPMGWCHTNPNAMIVVMALLYGEKNFTKTICLAVQAAFDTDCNGATAGSIIGIMLGAGKIESYWNDAFYNKLRTSIDGYNLVSIEELTQKTVELIMK